MYILLVAIITLTDQTHIPQMVYEFIYYCNALNEYSNYWLPDGTYDPRLLAGIYLCVAVPH